MLAMRATKRIARRHLARGAAATLPFALLCVTPDRADREYMLRVVMNKYPERHRIKAAGGSVVNLLCAFFGYQSSTECVRNLQRVTEIISDGSTGGDASTLIGQ